jgi:hypothetical protein
VSNLDDLELQPPPDPEPDQTADRTPWGVIIGLAVVLGVALALGYWYVNRDRPQEAAPTRAETPPVAPAAAPEESPAPLGGEPEPVDLPPLDASDPMVRDMVRRLSQHPFLTTWLTTDGLVRNFTVVVHNVASGRTPSVHLRRLAPPEPFRIRTQDGRMVLDDRSYRRYDRVAESVASVDPDDAARLYSTLKPRIEEAYRDLGFPDASFDQALERAIVELLSTPIVEGDVPVRPTRGTDYALTDPRLEDLSDAQKHLLRMGPENTRRIQDSLRQMARSLGIPDERLPRPQRIRSAPAT